MAIDDCCSCEGHYPPQLIEHLTSEKIDEMIDATIREYERLHKQHEGFLRERMFRKNHPLLYKVLDYFGF